MSAPKTRAMLLAYSLWLIRRNVAAGGGTLGSEPLADALNETGFLGP
jgi:hypothetical protein